VKSRSSSQCNETLLVMTVRSGKKFGFQSAAENLQRRRRLDRLRQTADRPRLVMLMCAMQGESGGAAGRC